jgi:cyclase
MLDPRIIPCLLIKDGGLVKTVRFATPKYVGDPINAVRIFNEKEVDELIVLDIDSTSRSREPNYSVIANLAAECRMPLCYGGGVTSVAQFERLVSLGVEKVGIGAAAITHPELVSQASTVIGSQSVVVVLDVRKTNAGYRVSTHNGSRLTELSPHEVAKRMEESGAGEIVINSVDRDGTMNGYDTELVTQVRASTNLPLTVLGGAGSLNDIADLIRKFGLIGAAAGSLFVFKGPYKAVLLNYPSRLEKRLLIDSATRTLERSLIPNNETTDSTH